MWTLTEQVGESVFPEPKRMQGRLEGSYLVLYHEGRPYSRVALSTLREDISKYDCEMWDATVGHALIDALERIAEGRDN